MAILSNLKAMADRMIAAEGQAVNVYFVDIDGNGYDPDTGTTTNSSPVVVASKAILLNYALESTGGSVYRDTLIEKDDRECYLSWQAGFPRTPSATGDYLIDRDGVKWRIITVKHNNPTGALEIMLNLQLRR